MSDAMRCDFCGIYSPTAGAVGWWRVEVPPCGIEVSTMGDPATPFDFCGWRCLAQYAGVRVESLRRRGQ